MSYIVILMSFQTIYSINYGAGVNTPGPCWTKTLKSLEPPFSISRTFRALPPLMPEHISVPPSPPPPPPSA